MSTQSTTAIDPRLVECEKHWLPNCSTCNHPGRLPYVKRYTPPSAVGTTKVEVVSQVASLLDLSPQDFSTAGEYVEFWKGLATALNLQAGVPAFVAEQACFRAEVDWTDECHTDRSYVSLLGLLRVRDAVVKLHRGE